MVCIFTLQSELGQNLTILLPDKVVSAVYRVFDNGIRNWLKLHQPIP